MNRSPHLSDDELIARLYGLGNMEEDEGHVAGCSECGDRFYAMRKLRAQAVQPADISARALAVQRQQILERVEQPSSGSPAWRWVPAAAVATLLAVALVLSRPASVTQSVPVAVNAEADAALFSDVYSMEQDVEPRAAAPIRALFQETSFESAEKESQ